MARREKYVAYGDEAKRDRGKTFLLTEMVASKVEDWALRLYLAMAQQEIDIPEGVASLGAQGLAIVGLKALHQVKYEDAKALSRELMDCVQYVMDPGGLSPNPRKLIEEDIEEVETRLWLKNAVFELHVGFSLADAGIDVGVGALDEDDTFDRVEYPNVPSAIGTVVSARLLATLHELSTIYGLKDLYDMLEIVSVDAINRRIARQQSEED